MSVRRWARVRRRPRIRVPYGLRFVLKEILRGVLLGAIAFGTSLLISEFGVYVSLSWMIAEKKILTYFYILFWLISGMFMIIPAYHKRLIFLLSSLTVVIGLWFLLTDYFCFDPIRTFFTPSY